jgi:hypothetical protein
MTAKIEDQRTIMPRQTRRTVATNPTQPLNTNAVADFHITALGTRAHLDNLAYTLVTADLAGLSGVRQLSPAVGHDT